MNHAARMAVLAGIAAVSAGCTTSSIGQPLPTGDGSAPSITSAGQGSGTPTSLPAPARPRQIRLDDKDPCALIPESDWPMFYIEKPGRRRQADPTFKSPDCFYSNNIGAFGITLVVTEGIGKWTDGSRSGVAEPTGPVEEFPAISIKREGDNNGCDVAVDVAEGQYLLADVNIDTQNLPKVPEPCTYAHQLAESAMKTLVRS